MPAKTGVGSIGDPRPVRSQRCAAASRLPSRVDRHRPAAASPRTATVVGPAGVHAAEQRLDQPVAHLAPHPLGDEPPDADVLVQVWPLQPDSSPARSAAASAR